MPLRNTLTLMVVDDMSVSRSLVEQALDEIGIQKVAFEREKPTTLRRLAANPTHLVLSDYNMPGMDGLSLLEALRANASTQRIAFILMAGWPDRSIISGGHQLGMNDFIAKPFTTQGLKGCIEKIVGAL